VQILRGAANGSSILQAVIGDSGRNNRPYLPAFYQVELLNYLPDFLNLSDRYS